MCTPLHERLKQARERRGLSLEMIAKRCGVRERSLQLVERNRFEELPSGIYARCAVRGYAAAVGLPADEAVGEVIERLPVPEDPLDGLARVRGLVRRQHRRQLTDYLPSPSRLLSIEDSWRPQAAAAFDAIVLLALDLVVLELTALVAGVRAADILRLAAVAMVVLFAVIAGLYFILLGGLGRATLGSRAAHASFEPAILHGVFRMLRLRRA